MGILDDPTLNLGQEGAGIVTAVGKNVNHVTIGDRVFMCTTTGGFASRARAPGTSTAKIPDDLDFESAATMPTVFSTVVYSLLYAGQMVAGDVSLHAEAISQRPR
jgi:phthiocerol/phenolphthiocerol synthesis type-I polyketide synthase C